jgi:hypothetical protein
MKKTLIMGLALVLGLSACEDIIRMDGLTYIKVKNDTGEVLGDNFNSEGAVETKGAVVLDTRGASEGLSVETTFLFWDLGHTTDGGLDHKVGISENFELANSFPMETGIPFTYFALVENDIVGSWYLDGGKPKFVKSGGTVPEDATWICEASEEGRRGNVVVANDYVALVYKCPIALWGEIINDQLVSWSNYYHLLPAVKWQVFSDKLTVIRLAPEVEGGETISFEMHIKGSGYGEDLYYVLNPNYTAVRIDLPNAIAPTV